MIRRSDSTAELVKALAFFHQNTPPVFKTATNDFLKSKYADLASIKLVCDPVLHSAGLIITQFPGCADGHPTLITCLVHFGTGEFMEAEARLVLMADNPQQLGSAITYMRRYAYCAILGVLAEPDDDAEGAMRRGAFVPDPVHTSYQQPRYEEINGEQIPVVPPMETTRSGPPSDLPTDKQRNFAKALVNGVVGAGPLQESKTNEWFKEHGLRWNGSWNNISRSDAKVIIETLKTS